MKSTVPKRFDDEKLASYWKVNKSRESFDNLMWHIQVKTHLYFSFMQSINTFFKLNKKDNLIIADIGGGVGWTSVMLAKNPKVKKVYLVEPSLNRVKSFDSITNHLEVSKKKVEFINGSFQSFNLPEKVDVILMCASIHHCHKDYLDLLFKNIKENLIDENSKSSIIISNEHYVNFFFSIFRLSRLVLNLFSGKKVFWNIFNLRHHDPKDHEHFRTIREIKNIFKKYKYNYKIFEYKLDICNDKLDWKSYISTKYYYAILGK